MYNSMPIFFFTNSQYQAPFVYSSWPNQSPFQLQNNQNFQMRPLEVINRTQEQSLSMLQVQQLQIGQENQRIQQVKKEEKPRKILRVSEQQLKTLKSTYKKFHWSPQDDKRLLQLVEVNYSWVQICSFFPNSTTKMCISRYNRLTRSSKKKWSQKQQMIVKKLVLQVGAKWKYISDQLKTKSPKRIREHYMNCLQPNKNNKNWSVEQDLQLARLVEAYGKKWKFFEQKLPDRTENHIKNRYYGRIKKIIDKKNEIQNKRRKTGSKIKIQNTQFQQKDKKNQNYQ